MGIVCVSSETVFVTHTVCHSGKFSIKTVVHSVFLTVSINLFNSNSSLNLKLSVYRGHIFIIICTVTPKNGMPSRCLGCFEICHTSNTLQLGKPTQLALS